MIVTLMGKSNENLKIQKPPAHPYLPQIIYSENILFWESRCIWKDRNKQQHLFIVFKWKISFVNAGFSSENISLQIRWINPKPAPPLTDFTVSHDSPVKSIILVQKENSTLTPSILTGFMPLHATTKFSELFPIKSPIIEIPTSPLDGCVKI